VTQRTPIVIVGAGGFGREIAWLVDAINQDHPSYDFLGFVDDAGAAPPEGYDVLDTLDGWVARPRAGVQMVCAIGDPYTRLRVARRLDAAGSAFATLVHPNVERSRWVRIGAGSMVCAGNILTTNITVGEHCLINLDCTIGHDARVGEFASLMPGVHISGDVDIGAGVYFGTGAAVINNVRLGAWSIVGAGAVVAGDLPGGVVAVGVPAKPIKANTRVPDEGGA
jgi:sugar O-acyltransferase (sialic acid O-acetyltransferase NeuD family)